MAGSGVLDVDDETSPHPVRSTDLDVLRSALAGLRRGHGGTVEVAGDPGTGKSTLMARLRADAAARDLPLLLVTAGEFDDDDDLKTLAHAFGDLMPDLGTPDLDGGLGRRPGRGRSAALARWYRTVAHPRLRAWLTELTGDGLVLVFDDTHRADEQTAQFLTHLVTRPLDAPILLVIAHRPRQTCPRLRGALARGAESGTVRTVQLGPLTLEQSAAVLDRPVTDPDTARLHAAADGNPFYLRALATGPDCDGSAATFSALLLAEVSSLRPRTSTVLHAAAVLGKNLDVDALCAVAELDQEQTCAALAELQSRDLVRQDGARSALRFRHPLLRDVVYRDVPSCWRRGAHRRARALLTARGAPAAELAPHVEGSLGTPTTDDLEVLADAARESMASDPRTSVRLFQLCAQLATSAPTRQNTRLWLSRALVASGRLAQAREVLHGLLHGDVTAAVRVAAVADCALVECVLGRYAEANTVLSVELAALSSSQRPGDWVRLTMRRAVIGLFEGDLPERASVEAALAQARRDGDDDAEAGALALLALFDAYHGDSGRAVELAAACAAMTDGQADAVFAAQGDRLTLLGWAERMLARFAEAERHLSRHVSIIRKSGVNGMLPIALMGQSMNHQAVARLAEARHAAVEAIQAAEHLGSVDLREIAAMLESAYLAWTERGTAEAGELAVTRAEQAVAVHLPRNWWFRVHSTLLLARILEIQGQRERCLKLVLNVGGGPELPHVPPAIRPRCYEMLAYAAAQNADASAGQWAARSAHAAETIGQPYQLGCALLAAGHWRCATGRLDLAQQLYLDAAERFAGISMTGAQIRALTMAARSAADGGDSQAAAAHLTLAKDLALQCGAAVLYDDAERLRVRLLTGVTPGKPAKAPAIDLSVLTTREREIALIASTGKRTRQIAEELSLSPRTVELHLSRVYRKLNVVSRAALASLVVRAG